MDSNLSEHIHQELAKGRQARALGLEGKARVCARRAAGWATQAYLAQRTAQPIPTSAYAALRALLTQPDLNPIIIQLTERLTLRVDESYQLPAEIDLLSDAEKLIQLLQEGTPT